MKIFSDLLTDESKNNFIRTSAEFCCALAMLNNLFAEEDIKTNLSAREKLEEIKVWTKVVSKYAKQLESIELVLKEDN